jgi:hypothetical protein
MKTGRKATYSARLKRERKCEGTQSKQASERDTSKGGRDIKARK